ncbi:mediator of RNA polymerase II transcription subunit 12-like protein [Aplysia californica]|uniref:Mediator of RNA polymerase II transcription subunit 12-like protein n=1 Tax=Aplysia californica TaxID=6500 RepID=A0ABM0ZYF0_APLCA|nr:mediator of RNA polymerase II transcription subunit 12-like protein [Aplysia californica]
MLNTTPPHTHSQFTHNTVKGKMAAAFPSQEHRPVKKPKLGPPDVYPQDSKQKEDELNQQNVKQGFQLGTIVSDECGSEKGLDITLEKCSTFYNNLFKKRTDQNTLQDSKNKKFQLPVKDNFWPAACSKVSTEAWFRDLAGNKPLASLSKKVPTFNKKEEIFSTLCENAVPHVRAAWFIKMTAAHNMGTQDSRNRRKLAVDQSMDWTQALTKYLKDQLQKIQDFYHGTSTPQATPFLLAQAPNPSQVDLDLAMKNWNYCTRFANHMYEEGLFDRHEFLSWIIELPDKMKQVDDVVLKLILAQLNTYSSDICKSVILARRLAHFCGKKIVHLIAEMDHMLGRTDPMVSSNGTPLTPAQAINTTIQMCNPLINAMAEFKECQSHRYIVLQLCALAQIITIKCPTAMVWNALGEGKSNIYLTGSPLDMFPCATSNLPMPPGSNNSYIRSQLKIAEQQIIARGHAAEVHWSSDKCQQSAVGYVMSKVLEVLDILDQHNFDIVDGTYNMDSLYGKIFSLTQRKETGDPPIGDEPIINLLVDWAVSTQRVGDHRCIVVALLLERRQSEIRSEKYGEVESSDEKEVITDTGTPPVFQSLLMSFLDTRAPVLEEHASEEAQQAFKNLILLFNELIVHDVFSHDAYMHMLISRGDLGQAPAYTTPLADNEDLFSVKSQPESIKHEVSLVDDDIKVDMDIHTVEENLGSFFGSLKDEPKPSPEQPDLSLGSLNASVKSIKSDKEQPLGSVGDFSANTTGPPPLKGPSRHMVYATHFPIPQDIEDEDFGTDDCSSHEINQRMIVLYGVGKARDEARHLFKKISKEIVRLFSKRNCVDVTSGDLGKVKKKKEKETKEGETSTATPSTSNPSTMTTPNFDSMQQKFAKLSYFDQHQVTAQCTAAVLDQIKSFTAGNFTYLPLGDNISFLFDLMQQALNISGLLEFIIRLLKDLVEVEKELHQKESFLMMTYTTEVCLNIVAVLRRYHSYLLSPQGLSSELFIGLTDILKVVNVCNPINCSTAERCVLTYLYDIYTTCSPLQMRHSEIFNPAYTKMKATLFAQINPSCTNAKWDQNEMKDIITSAKLPEEANRVHKSLGDSATTRYSFVCNAMLEVVSTQPDNLRNINDLAVLCAELTAHCNSLSEEWLGVLKALCCSSQQDLGFIDVLTTIDVGDLSIHDSLAVFTAMLIARHCFSLQDFVYHVALPSLMAVCCPEGDAEAEPGARLSCHLLLRLFKPSYLIAAQSGLSGVKNPPLIRNSCDRHLLEAAHLFIGVGPMLAVLKAMLKLADEPNEDSSSKGNSGSSRDKSGVFFADLLRNLDNDFEMEALINASSGGGNGKDGLGSGSLSEFAKRALTEICRQDWVREKFLRNPAKLFTNDLLNENILSYRQAQQLLQMICYPTGVPNQMEGCEPENKHVVERVLQTLDQWTQRVSWLELQLLFERSQNQTETNTLLDLVSRGTIDLFHQLTENQNGSTSDSPMSLPTEHKSNSENTIWLVAPLIAKLPNAIQGRVLKLAAQVLESGNNLFVSAKSKQEKEKNMKSKSLLGHQPFLSLVLSCLKGQDEQREFLLRSLMNQMEMFIGNSKDMMDKTPDESKIRQHLHEALHLRLSLVGGMFDMIQRNNAMTSDWALILVQLVSHDVVDCQVNSELFLTIVDMLAVLIHGTLLSEGQEKGDDNKKPYLNVIKKLRRELGDKNSAATDQIRQLLPLPKQPIEVITVEPYGAVLDNKGNRVPGLDATGKKAGLQVAQKVPFNAWEIIEGHKNIPPIPWSFFGAVRMEKKALKYEDQKRIDLYHTHTLRKPLSYFLEPPVLPPEDLEPIPEKIDDKPKEPAEVSADSNKKPISKRVKKRPKPAASTAYHMSPNNAMRPFYPQEPMYGQPGPPQMWPYGPSGPQNPYVYTQQPPQQRPRMVGGMGNSKMVLSNMLYKRSMNNSQGTYLTPPSQMPPGAGMSMQKSSPHHNALRQHILHRSRGMMDTAQGGMYAGTMPAQAQGAMGHPMGQPQGNYYGSMPQGRMIDPMSGGGTMMPGSFNQGYQGAPQAGQMMGGAMAPQTGFMPAQASGQATPQYSNNPQRMSAGMAGMPAAASSTINSYSQGPMAPSAGPPGQHQQSYMGTPMANSQMQLRQQMMAMQQQQQQQQQPQPGMTPMQAPQQRNVMSMRRMSSGMQGPPPGPAPQYGSYPQY